jgi:hypothetical protein
MSILSNHDGWKFVYSGYDLSSGYKVKIAFSIWGNFVNSVISVFVARRGWFSLEGASLLVRRPNNWNSSVWQTISLSRRKFS